MGDKLIKRAYGIASAADTGDNRIGQPAFLFHQLLLDFSANDLLEISYNRGEGMGPHD